MSLLPPNQYYKKMLKGLLEKGGGRGAEGGKRERGKGGNREHG